MRVVFVHPDLGIGGAERLVVDAALALKAKGHQVNIVTAHHDTAHSFKETRDGTIDVTVAGDWLPRSIAGRGCALCAYLRMIFAAFYLIFASGMDFDLVFCDSISACIPVLRLFRPGVKVVFYCHFPDQLLTIRTSVWKKVYRGPIDWVEEWSTGMAHCILVNSQFTGEQFRKTFRSLRNVQLSVVYPSVNMSAFDEDLEPLPVETIPHATHVFLSINRYERKKNIALAIQAFGVLETKIAHSAFQTSVLVIAGGYDELVQENIDYYEELKGLITNLGLDKRVIMLRSPSESVKRALIDLSTAVLYTPSNEHFGIVPLEAMYCRRPVIAVASGGPLETVIDGQTGFLVPADSESFAEAMAKLMNDSAKVKEMGESGRRRVVEKFGFQAFSTQLDEIVRGVSTVVS